MKGISLYMLHNILKCKALIPMQLLRMTGGFLAPVYLPACQVTALSGDLDLCC